jgi:chromosome segregation ATPase
MKQAIKWMSYLEVVPEHFEASKWVFRNRSVLVDLVDVSEDIDFLSSQVEGLTVGLSDVRSGLEDVRDRTEDLGVSVKTHGSQISGLSEQVQRNRDEFYQELNSQSERIDETRSMAQDVVERVDYTRQEVGEVEERLERTREELSERVESDYELMREEVDGVSQRLNGVVQQNLELQNNQEDIMQELQMQRKQNAKKMDKLIEEQQKTFVDRVRDNMKSVKGVVSSIATSLF